MLHLCQISYNTGTIVTEGQCMRYIDEIIKMDESDGGYVTSRSLKEKVIPTVYLMRMVNADMLRKLAEGIYKSTN